MQQEQYWKGLIVRKEEDMIAVTESGRRIILNVQGCRYETFQETLEEFPETLLGSAEKRKRFYDPLRDEYYFERDKGAFDAILFYYQSRGILSRPSTIPANAFDEELRFYEIKTVKPAEQKEKMIYMPERDWQGKLWELLEYPESSKQAALFSKLSMAVIILSVVVFCAETMYSNNAATRAVKSLSVHNNTKNASSVSQEEGRNPRRPRVWFVIDTCIIVWFSSEYAARLVSSPEKIKFLLSALALIDLAAIIPYFLTLLFGNTYAPAFSFTVMRIFRLLRVVRLLKLTRYVAALRILGYTVRSCKEQLIALFFLISISVVLFSSTIFYVENKENREDFCSIPASFWWTIITMTTVGYGDMTPITPIGKMVGALCAIFGVVVMVCLPSPVFISSFNEIYMQHVGEMKKNQRKSSNGVKRHLETTLDPSNVFLIKNLINGKDDNT